MRLADGARGAGSGAAVRLSRLVRCRYEDCKKLATTAGVPVKAVFMAAEAAYLALAS